MFIITPYGGYVDFGFDEIPNYLGSVPRVTHPNFVHIGVSLFRA